MLNKKEKFYLIILVISAILLIFTAIYLTNNCPECDKTYSRNDDKPIVVYRIG